MNGNANNGKKGYLFNISAVIGGILLVILILECNANIIGRYFRMPIRGSFDFLSLMGCLLVAISLIFTELNNGHIVISIFLLSIARSTNFRKLNKSIVHIITIISVLLLLFSIVYHIITISIPENEPAMTLQISLIPFRICWAFAWLLLVIGIIKNIYISLKEN